MRFNTSKTPAAGSKIIQNNVDYFPNPFLHIKRLEFTPYKSQNPNMAVKYWGALEERRKPGGKGCLGCPLPA